MQMESRTYGTDKFFVTCAHPSDFYSSVSNDGAAARDVNEPGPSPQARKPAGTFPSSPGPQPAFFSPHLQIHQKI